MTKWIQFNTNEELEAAQREQVARFALECLTWAPDYDNSVTTNVMWGVHFKVWASSDARPGELLVKPPPRDYFTYIMEEKLGYKRTRGKQGGGSVKWRNVNVNEDAVWHRSPNEQQITCPHCKIKFVPEKNLEETGSNV